MFSAQEAPLPPPPRSSKGWGYILASSIAHAWHGFVWSVKRHRIKDSVFLGNLQKQNGLALVLFFVHTKTKSRMQRKCLDRTPLFKNGAGLLIDLIKGHGWLFFSFFSQIWDRGGRRQYHLDSVNDFNNFFSFFPQNT